MGTNAHISNESTLPYKSGEMGKGRDVTGSTTGKSTVIFLDASKRNKPVRKTGEALVRNVIENANKTEATSDDILEYLKHAVKISEGLRNDAIKISERLKSEVNSHKVSAYDNTLLGNVNEIKEAEDKLNKVQRKFNLYKYYSLIWILSVILAGLFAIVGVSGLLGPFPSVTGVIVTVVGMIGAYLDWKDRERTYDS